MNQAPVLAIIIPCFNEEEALRQTTSVLGQLIRDLVQQEKIREGSYLLMVDDGSRDATWNIIESLHEESKIFHGLKLSRNFGHQHALLAGLNTVDDADVSVSMDADLQHDPKAVYQMLEAWQRGSEIVYGVRQQREGDGFFKKTAGNAFYKLLKSLGGEFIHNHADYRLMSRRALDALKEFKEVNLYLRGMVPMVGFRYEIVSFQQHDRIAGESKYGLRKMLSFAWNGISSMSIKPLRLVTTLGFIVFFISLIMSCYALVAWATGRTAPGWASTIIAMYFLGGIQLLCIGMIGEYIGKIYKEVKHRPRYIIEKELQ